MRNFEKNLLIPAKFIDLFFPFGYEYPLSFALTRKENENADSFCP